MIKRPHYAIPIALLMIIIGVLITGCEGLSLTPPASEYPADIIGRVVITEYIQNWFMDEPGTLTPKEGNTFWVVNISVKNKTYSLSALREIQGYKSGEPIYGYKNVWGYWDWGIEIAGKTYNPPEAFKVLRPTILTIAEGETAKLVNCFEVPKNLSIDEAKLLYRGQQPYSYGQLTGGDKAAVYDFASKKAITASRASQKTVATVQNIWAGIAPSPFIMVELKPTSAAIANKTYIVDLYEKGRLRASKAVTFNQPQINVRDMVPVSFPATKAEGDAYMWQDISHIFSVKVHE